MPPQARAVQESPAKAGSLGSTRSSAHISELSPLPRCRPDSPTALPPIHPSSNNRLARDSCYVYAHKLLPRFGVVPAYESDDEERRFRRRTVAAPRRRGPLLGLGNRRGGREQARLRGRAAEEPALLRGAAVGPSPARPARDVARPLGPHRRPRARGTPAPPLSIPSLSVFPCRRSTIRHQQRTHPRCFE
jgi:hypothetical protein